MKFIPSLELSQMLFEQKIQPIMAKRFPNLKYAAATLGMCSEVLGLDDEISMDHEWGPRIRLYLAEQDHGRYAADVMSAFWEELPLKFAGFDMMWRQPGVDIHDTRETVLYHITVGTVSNALNFCGGLAALPLPDVDWLRVSEQHLLEFTSGVVYRDDVGELTRARELLKYYPDNVLRFLLMCEWNAVGGDWFPIGRIGSRGDRLGLRLMRIAFIVCKKYYTYKKWFGTLFKELPLAGALEPILIELFEEGEWQQVEETIGRAASILLQQQNKLGIAPEITMEPEQAEDGRHHIQYDFWEIGRQIAEQIQPPLKAVMENQVFWLHERSLILWNGKVGK